MLIMQQITALILGAFSVSFMLWFLANTLRDSRSLYKRRAHTPIPQSESWQFRTLGPQVPSSSVRVQSNSGKSAPRPEPQFAPRFTQSSRFPHPVSR
jgi:hypothetical protein